MSDLNFDLNQKLNQGFVPHKPVTPPKPTENNSAPKPLSISAANQKISIPTAAKKQTPSLAKLEKNDFSLPDFAKSKVVSDSGIYNKNFRFKTREALKGTLKHAVDRKTVADLLWNKRGHGGITKDELKFGLRKLESSGKLSKDQVRAVRRKMKAW